MKKADAEKMLNALNMLDDDLLSEALITDDSKKLMALKNQSRPFFLKPSFLRVAILVLVMSVISVALIITSVNKGAISTFTGNNLSSHNNSSTTPEGTSSEKEETETSSDASSVDDNESEEPDYGDYFIDSIDKFNYYLVKAVIENGGVLPLSEDKDFKNPKVQNLSNKIIYEINRDTVFTVARVTYFRIKLVDESGFLAKKLGGIGLVEVAVTESNLYDMITFKRGDSFYSCLLSLREEVTWTFPNEILYFSTQKAIDEFNIVENSEQKNFRFAVYYDNYIEYSQVANFRCLFLEDGEAEPDDYLPEQVFFLGESSIFKLYQSFTITDLEEYITKSGGYQ